MRNEKTGQFRASGKAIIDRIFEGCVPEPNSGCWIWMGARINAYGQGSIWVDGRKVRVHRASFMAFRGEDPGDLFVCHKCDVAACANPDHLFLGTSLDNQRDAARKGRMARGERQHLAKMDEDKVREIRSLEAAGMEQRDIAARFDISQSSVWSIARRKTWHHVI